MTNNLFVHAELSVDDVAPAKKFYKSLFDWKFQDLGPAMGNYVMVDLGSKTSGGGLTPKRMPNQPSAWLSDVEVISVKKTTAKAAHGQNTQYVRYRSIE